MPRNNNDFVSGLKRMGQALGYYGYVPTGDSFSNNVKPRPAGTVSNPVPQNPTVGIRRMPPAKGGGGMRGGGGFGIGIGKVNK